MKRISMGLTVLLAAGLLAACGGGSTGPVADPPVATEVPASAIASTQAYIDFTGKLQASDTAAPLGLGKVDTVPTSETDAPATF